MEDWQKKKKAVRDGGYLIDFDLPVAVNYFVTFREALAAAGWRVQRQPGSANVVKAWRGQQTALFYFQGAGLTAWWAFQWHVVEKNREEGVPFYLVVGMQKNSVAEYWFHRLGETEIWENRKHLTRATLEHNGFERQQAAGGIL